MDNQDYEVYLSEGNIPLPKCTSCDEVDFDDEFTPGILSGVNGIYCQFCINYATSDGEIFKKNE